MRGCWIARASVCGGALALATLAGTAWGADVAWRSETFGDPLAIAAIGEAQRIDMRGAIDRAALDGQLREAATLQTPRRMVVTFGQVLDDADRAELEAGGVRVLGYLGGGSYFATVDPGRLAVDAVAQIARFRGVEPIAREWKMHPALLGEAMPDHAILINGDDPKVAVYAMFHPDVTLDQGRDVARHGGMVRDDVESINTLVVELRQSRLGGLIDEDAVQWVEPPLPRMSGTNSENRVLTEVDTLQGAPFNLDGTGVTALIYDGGNALASHQDFGGRLTVHDTSGVHYHPTHVAGTVGGSGSVTLNNRGMAPNVTMLSYGFEFDGSGTFLYTNPGDIQADYFNAFVNQGAMVSNNSIGSNVEPNGFNCAFQGDYGATSALIDAIAGGSLGVDTRILWAAGNERQGSRCDIEGFGDYYSSAPPSGAKNSIGVGAVNSDTDLMTTFSSWGPTDDGRLKPDITAPGCQVAGDGGVTSTGDGSNTEYITICGTSMATPTATGIVALMLQDFMAQFPTRGLPINSTIKVLLAHNAVDRGNVGPDYQFGYGSIRAEESVVFMRSDQFIEDTVNNGESVSVDVNVGPGEPFFKATLAWDDVPGTPNVSPSLINDLDLVVIDPSGGRHYPWTLDPLAPSVPAVQTVEDHLNNMEQVFVSSPEQGLWQIEIVGTAVPQGPQTFSLATSSPPVVSGLFMSLVSAIPDYVDPGVNIDVDVDVSTVGESLVGTPEVFWRYNGGGFLNAPLTPAGGMQYTVSLPPPDCADTVEFYFQAEGDVSGTKTLPALGAAGAYSPSVGALITPTLYEFEVASGWVVDAEGTDDATTGAWNRMDPEATGAQPEDDNTPDPGVLCWVTDGNAGTSLGEFDIDTGTTTLTSPDIDLTGLTNVIMSYARWYSNNAGADPNNDVFIVEISANAGASWTNVETIGPAGASTGGGWVEHSFDPSSLIALTNQVRLRFIASDLNLGSIVEAAVDDVRVTAEVCVDVPPGDCPGDLDGDNDVDIFDFGAFASNFGLTSGATREQGDLDGDGDVDIFDFAELAGAFGSTCP